MKIIANQPLADLTSFGVGGCAEKYIKVSTTKDLIEIGQNLPQRPYWLLGQGTNSLISDEGLAGTTIHIQAGQIERRGSSLIADSGVVWDELVAYSIENGLWGLELMSGIPGGVGAAVYININAYGQAVADTIDWVEVLDTDSGQISRLSSKVKDWGYKCSPFQNKPLIILRASFKLSFQATTDLAYQAALDEAKLMNISPNDLASRRQIILATRDKAGALISDQETKRAKTAGSFFRNPLVSRNQAEQLVKFDESNRTKAQLKTMNRLHGGSSLRVSAAHVLLAAGFRRDQGWGQVRLHPEHVLKIENMGAAEAQDIYDVAQTIKQTVKQKLGIELETEVEILGEFT